MHTPENILEGAYNYIFFIFLGIPATFLYNLLAGIIRSLGDSRTPVIFLMISSLLNVALDFFFIVCIGTGAEGAAYATVISQAVSGVLCLIYMRKKFAILKMERDELPLDKIHVKILCGMGIPMGLQYSITAIGSVVIQTAINGLGSTAVASVAAAQKVSMLFCCPFDALGGTMATYAGQNVGAKKLDRVAQGVHAANGIGIIYALAAFGVTVVFGKQIPCLFVDAAEGEVIRQAYQYMLGNALFFVALVFVNVYRFTIQGLGFSGFAVFAGAFEMVARGLMGFAMVPLFGYPAVCLSSPLAWIFADIFLIPAFGHCMKRLQRQFGEEEKQAVLRAKMVH